MKFNYIAITETGKEETGVVEASNSSEAKKILLTKGLTLLSVKSLEREKKIGLIIPFLGGISFLDRILFAKNLALMIKAGLSLGESLAIIKEQTKSRKFKQILDAVIKSINSGHSLADSLARHPRAFDALYINMIKIGEESGTLEENLESLSLRLEKSHQLRNKVKAAMIYPSIIIIATLVLSVGIIFFVLPKIIPIFKTFDIQLPLTTRILIWFTENIQSYGLFVLVGIMALLAILSLLSRVKAVRFLIHKLTLKLPIIGSITRDVNLAYFSRTLGVLLKSGVPIIHALDITRITSGNLIYQKELKEVTKEVKKGKSISNYLQQRESVFPLMVSRMVGVGERTGNLEETLIYVGNFYEGEIDRATKSLSTILEPILLLIIGTVVGFIALAIITPIYEITHGLYK
jgi:type IV pilus assembly protein PilC